MTEPKKERCGACTDGYITFVTDDGHLSLRTCRKCGGYGYIKVEPLTNEEWLKSCNTEQLAEWLARITNAGYLLALRMKYHCDDVDAVREWLKEKHQMTKK